MNEPDNPEQSKRKLSIFCCLKIVKVKFGQDLDWNGLNLFEPGIDGFIRYQSDANNPYSINSDWVWAINEDRTGVLWFGCWLTGLNKLDLYKKKFKHYKHIPGNSK